MKILGIETSCDDTAAAVVEVHEEGGSPSFSVLSNVASSQTKAHNKTGGVVPEVAARAHQEKILAVIEEALRALEMQSIDAIAVTYGPGLLTSLMVGSETAKTLSYLWDKPLIGVNHMAGHIYANWLPVQGTPSPDVPTSPTGLNPLPQGEREKIGAGFSPRLSLYGRGPAEGGGEGALEFPALALLVSGGHTELVLMRGHLDFKVIGKTRDDAAGECFDKVAKMLGLGYPGGPEVARLADEFKSCHPERSEGSLQQALRDSSVTPQNDNGGMVRLPRPMLDSKDYDFSFSGLKTAVMYWLKEQGTPSPFSSPPRGEDLQKKDSLCLEGRGRSPVGDVGTSGEGESIAALCHEVQNAIVEVLVVKTIRAAKEYNVKTVMLGGGVAANNHLRQELGRALTAQLPTITYTLVPKPYTTDNAAMIAAAGYFYSRANKFVSWKELRVDAHATLSSI